MTTLMSLNADARDLILKRLPVETLVELKPLARLLNKTISEERFVYVHQDFSKNIMFLGFDEKVRIVDPRSGVVKSSTLQDVYPSTTAVIHCDGLILTQNIRENLVSICNPFMGTIVTSLGPKKKLKKSDCFGFGYASEKSRGNYQILRFRDAEKGEQTLDIYDVEKVSWTVAPTKVSINWKIERGCQGLSVQGRMAWIAKHTDKSPGTYCIQSFDFSSKSFKEVCLLPEVLRTETETGSVPTVCLSVYRGKGLSLLHQPEAERDIHVWLMDTLSGTWNSTFRVTSQTIPTLRPPLIFCPQPVHFIDEDNNIVILSFGDIPHTEEEEEEEEEEGEEQGALLQMHMIVDEVYTRQELLHPVFPARAVCGYVYVPSLVPVPRLN